MQVILGYFGLYFFLQEIICMREAFFFFSKIEVYRKNGVTLDKEYIFFGVMKAVVVVIAAVVCTLLLTM
jgi:hypothetical protein